MKQTIAGGLVGTTGLLLLLYYLVVRLTVMDVLTASVAQADVHTIRELLANLSSYLVAYLLWVYSFKLGMLLVIIGAALKSGMGSREVWTISLGGAIYLLTCYLPFVGYSPSYYGVLGIVILVLFVLLAWLWLKRRPTLPRSSQVASDLRMIGYYFLVVATWSLCGIFGVVTYALKPEVMIERGLQPTATMLTSHVMVELTLGWVFVFLAAHKEKADP